MNRQVKIRHGGICSADGREITCPLSNSECIEHCAFIEFNWAGPEHERVHCHYAKVDIGVIKRGQE